MSSILIGTIAATLTLSASLIFISLPSRDFTVIIGPSSGDDLTAHADRLVLRLNPGRAAGHGNRAIGESLW